MLVLFVLIAHELRSVEPAVLDSALLLAEFRQREVEVGEIGGLEVGGTVDLVLDAFFLSLELENVMLFSIVLLPHLACAFGSLQKLDVAIEHTANEDVLDEDVAITSTKLLVRIIPHCRSQ